MSEFEADPRAQLKEGYAHIKKADIKNYRIAIGELLQHLDFVIDSAKATRKSKSKVYSADKLVAKLKYCTTDEKYKLASIFRFKLLVQTNFGCLILKQEKIGKYVATNIDPKGMQRQGSGLSVKGTTIIGYNETESIQKHYVTAEQLKEFKDAGESETSKFMMTLKQQIQNLTAGAIPDTVLLKVV